MQITSGKHDGKTSQILVLNYPDYAKWYRREYPTAKLGKAISEHIGSLNSKSFSVKCNGCSGQATKATAYFNNHDLIFWCDECDPYSMGAVRGKLNVIRTYQDAVGHIEHTANGNKNFMKLIVRSLAMAKGLPSRVTAVNAEAFFN
jgi:hypothetical protein